MQTLITKNSVSYGIIKSLNKPYANFIIQFNLYWDDWNNPPVSTQTKPQHQIISATQGSGYCFTINTETNNLIFTYHDSGTNKYIELQLCNLSNLSRGFHNFIFLLSVPNVQLYIDGQLTYSLTKFNSTITTGKSAIGIGLDTNGLDPEPQFGSDEYGISKLAVFQNVKNIDNVSKDMDYDENTPNLMYFYDFKNLQKNNICPVSGVNLELSDGSIIKNISFNEGLFQSKEGEIYSTRVFDNALNRYIPFANSYTDINLLVDKAESIKDEDFIKILSQLTNGNIIIIKS